MVINVSVRYNGGFLPEILLLTPCDYVGEEPLLITCTVELFVLTANVLIPHKPSDYSGGFLAAFRLF